MKGQREIKPNIEENMDQGLREVSWNRGPENYLSGDLYIVGFPGSSLSSNSCMECWDTRWAEGDAGW